MARKNYGLIKILGVLQKWEEFIGIFKNSDRPRGLYSSPVDINEILITSVTSTQRI